MSVVQRGARLRRSPFFEATQRHGPKGFTVYNHTLFPINFDDFEAEYWHLLNHVTLWDVAVERNVEVTGPDGFRFAQLLTCRDLSTCAVGQAKYVLITAPDGGILNDPVMLRLDENTFWFALADSDVLPYAKGLAAYAGMDVELSEAEAYPLQIQGPKSKDVVRDLFGDDVLDLRYYHFRRLELGRHPAHPHPHGLDLGGRVRDLSPRRLARNGSVGADHGSRAPRTRSGRPGRSTSAGSREASSTGVPT